MYVRFGGVVFVMASRTNNISVAYQGFLSGRNFSDTGEGKVIFGRFFVKSGYEI